MPIVIGSGGSSSSTAGLSSYSEIVGSIEEWLNRPDLEDRVPDFMRLLEAELNRVLRVPEMEEITTLSVSSGSSELPTDFLEARHLYIDGDIDSEIVLSSLTNFRRDYGVSSDTGRPLLYAIADGAFRFSPTPDTTYSVILHYYQKIPALTSSNTSNWVLASHPDIYLYGTLLMAEAFIFNDERLPLWRGAFDNAVAQLKGQGIGKRHGGGPLYPRPLPRPGPAS